MEQSISSSKKKKTKFRKMINRAKNGLQRAEKFCKRHVAPVVLSAAILGGCLFGTYLRSTASGLPELYVTYWDLVSSIFAAEGYDMTIKNGNDKISTPDRVTGRQLWNNIKTWVKLKTQDAKEVFDEFVALPKFVTAEGITMSKELYELLGDYCAEYSYSSTYENNFDCSSVKAVNDYIKSLTGGGYLDSGRAQQLVDGEALLNIIYDPYYSSYSAFTLNKSIGIVDDFRVDRIGEDFYSCIVKFPSGEKKFYTVYGSSIKNGKTLLDVSVYTCSPGFTWIVKNGTVAADVIDKVKDAVDLKHGADHPSLPSDWDWGEDNTATFPWWLHPDFLDDYMRNQTYTDEQMSDGDPDDGDDNRDKNGKSWKDIIPALIPFNPKTPSTTEKDTEKDTESGVPGKDPDPSKNPMINPDTGRYIDPDTGYDIDPDTGKLIDPDTGELIEPDIPSTAGKAGNWKRLFPFCIPWDMMELIKSMQADKKAPVFEFKYTFKAVNYTWVVKVDMADYWKYIKIFRWGMTIFFIIGLFFLTVKFTTFVQRMGG